MKKLKGCGCISLIFVLALFIFATVKILNADFQTKMANSVIEKNFPGSSLKRVRVKPGSFEFEGLALNLNPSTRIALQTARGNFATMALLTKSVELSDVSIGGLEITLRETADGAITAAKADSPTSAKSPTPSSPKTADAHAAATEGKQNFEFPNWSLSIENAKADASLNLPDSSRADFNLKLKSFTSERVVMVRTMDLDIEAVVAMEGMEKQNLSLRSTITPSNGATSIKLAFEKEGKRLLEVAGKVDAGFAQVETQTRINIDTADVKNIIGNAPDFNINAFAETNFDTDLTRIKSKFSLKASGQNLQAFHREIKNNPNLKFLETAASRFNFINEAALSAEFAGELDDGKLSIANSEVLLSANNEQIIYIKNASAFTLDPSNITQIPDGNLLAIDIPSLPASIVSALAAQFAEVSSGNVSANFILSKSGSEFLLKSERPPTIPNLKIVKNGEILIEEVSPTLIFEGTYDGSAARASALLSLNPKKGENLEISLQASHTGAGMAASVSANGEITNFIPRQQFSSPLFMSAQADFQADKKTASLENVKISMNAKEAGTLFEARQLSKISYSFENAKPIFEGDLLKLESKDVPFSFFAPFAKGVDAKSFSLTANASAKSESSIEVNAAVSFKSLSFSQNGVYMLRGLNPELNAAFSADLAAKTFSIGRAEFKTVENGAPILIASASASGSFADKFSVSEASLKANGSLPKILNQPVLEKFSNASNGSVEIDGKLKGEDLNARLVLANVSPRTSAETSGKVEADIVAKLREFMPANAKLDLKSESHRGVTSATATADFGDSVKIDIAAKTITTDDFEIIAQSLSNPVHKDGTMTPQYVNDSGKKRVLRPNDAAPTPSPAPTAKPQKVLDAKAAWDFGKDLFLLAKIGKIQRQNESVAEDVDGKLSLNAKEIKLETLSGNVFGAKLDSAASLIFDDKSHYDLKSAKAYLKGLRIEQFLKPNSAGEKMIEGPFDIIAELSGRSDSLETMGANLKGNASMVSGGGVLRILDRGSTIGAASEIGSALLKVGGGILGNRVKELSVIGELTGMLSQMNYSNIHVKMERGEDLDIKITDAEVRTVQMLLRTQGMLKHNPNLAFADQAIYFPVKLYAKSGEVSDLFKKAGLIQTGAASLDGYYEGPTFIVSGTVSSPESNLREVIANASARALGDGQAQPSQTQTNQPKSIEGALQNVIKGLAK